MTISSALTAMNTDIQNARTAITNKGGTVTSGGGSSQLATDIATIPSGGSAPVITSLNVTPTTSAQTITAPSGTDGYSPVNVAAVTASIDANIQAGNIKKDVTILNVTGTYEGSGGGGSKYGANINTILGDVDGDGVLQQPTEQSQLVFTGVQNIADYTLSHRFNYTNITSVSFPNLTKISGTYAMQYAFTYCYYLTSVSFPNLTTINGSYAMQYAFYYSRALASVSFPNLTTISGSSAMYYSFYGNRALTSVSFPNLTTISGSSAMRYSFYNAYLTSISFPNLTTISGSNTFQYAFQNCPNIADMYFNKVTTSTFATVKNQFASMFNSSTASTSGTVNIHFPSNLSSTVSGLTGYPAFGGNSSRVVLKFDLTATS